MTPVLPRTLRAATDIRLDLAAESMSAPSLKSVESVVRARLELAHARD